MTEKERIQIFINESVENLKSIEYQLNDFEGDQELLDQLIAERDQVSYDIRASYNVLRKIEKDNQTPTP